MKILAIDPGPEQSAYLIYNTETRLPEYFNTWGNGELLAAFRNTEEMDELAIEMIASYGMAVGKETFETCVWIGRFQQKYLDAFPHEIRTTTLITRGEIKMHLCGTMRAKDANIRQALLDRWGGSKQKAQGTKANPGPLYGISKHVWSALAVAVTVAGH